jgi:hypothetical protein
MWLWKVMANTPAIWDSLAGKNSGAMEHQLKGIIEGGITAGHIKRPSIEDTRNTVV